MFCSNCGTANKDDARFCVKCGESLSEIKGEEKTSAAKVLKNELSQKGAGFFKALFDFSFTQFITSKIIKLLYGLSILSSGILALILLIFFLLAGFRQSAAAGILALIVGTPICFLIFLVLVIYARVFLEIIIVVFRISEHTAEIAQQGRIEKKHAEG
jgi:hypothetical protein